MSFFSAIRKLLSRSERKREINGDAIYYKEHEIWGKSIIFNIFLEPNKSKKIKSYIAVYSLDLNEFKQIFNSIFTPLIVMSFQVDTFFSYYLRRLSEIRIIIIPADDKLTPFMAALPPSGLIIIDNCVN